MLRISFAPLNYTQDADQVVESYRLVPLGCIRLKELSALCFILDYTLWGLSKPTFFFLSLRSREQGNKHPRVSDTDMTMNFQSRGFRA